jgi:hypothetical protein
MHLNDLTRILLYALVLLIGVLVGLLTLAFLGWPGFAS